MVWHSHKPKAVLKILLLSLSFDKNFFVEELSNYAANGPHINRLIIVLFISQIEFGSPVVSGGNIFSEIVVFIDLISDNIRLTEITDFDLPVVINKNVERLEISMNDSFLVNVLNSFNYFE